MSNPGDRNFDDLAHRFQRNVYASLKGQIRLEVVQRDFEDYLLPSESPRGWQVFDAGGGQGRMSAWFARRGHRVLLSDISRKMLDLAESQLVEEGLAEAVQIRHAPIQEITRENPQRFDLIVCHAVLEWVADPRDLLGLLAQSLKPGGTLSLLYYNLNGLIYKNLLRTNFKKIRQRKWQGYRGSLTPSSPLRPEEVQAWLSELPLEMVCESGVRVFYDYIFNQQDRVRDPESIVEMELQFAREMPYKHLGRYIHVLCRKQSG